MEDESREIVTMKCYRGGNVNTVNWKEVQLLTRRLQLEKCTYGFPTRNVDLIVRNICWISRVSMEIPFKRQQKDLFCFTFLRVRSFSKLNKKSVSQNWCSAAASKLIQDGGLLIAWVLRTVDGCLSDSNHGNLGLYLQHVRAAQERGRELNTALSSLRHQNTSVTKPRHI